MFPGKKLAHLVENFGVLLQRLEAVGKPFGDEEHGAVLRGKLDGKVLLERRRGRPQVNDDVINRSRGTPHELGFRKRRNLEVHASQRAFSFVERDVALFHMRADSVDFKFLPAEGAGEKPALIGMRLQFDYKCAGQFRLRKNQVSPAARQNRSRAFRLQHMFGIMSLPAEVRVQPSGSQ